MQSRSRVGKSWSRQDTWWMDVPRWEGIGVDGQWTMVTIGREGIPMRVRCGGGDRVGSWPQKDGCRSWRFAPLDCVQWPLTTPCMLQPVGHRSWLAVTELYEELRVPCHTKRGSWHVDSLPRAAATTGPDDQLLGASGYKLQCIRDAGTLSRPAGLWVTDICVIVSCMHCNILEVCDKHTTRLSVCRTGRSRSRGCPQSQLISVSGSRGIHHSLGGKS